MSHRVEQLVAQLKALADPVRLRIVVLCAQGECSVSELTGVLGLSQPRVSQHLKQLCDVGLLEPAMWACWSAFGTAISCITG
jgi:ArsR family transcriptional regulator